MTQGEVLRPARATDPMERHADQAVGRRPRIALPVVAALVVIALFFGALGTWAVFAPLESAAIAPGVLSVETNRKTIQHLEGGIVEKILVSEGERVTAGQELLRLDGTQALATLDLLKGRYRALSALEARLVAERNGSEAVAFPDWLLKEEADPKVQEIIKGQVGIFEARRDILSSQAAILKQRILQFGEEITGLRDEIASNNRQLTLIAEEIVDVEKLLEGGLARRPRLLALQRQAASIEGNRSRNQAAIARAKQQIGETELQISELRTNLHNEIVHEQREVQTELFALAERLLAAEDVLRRTTIRARQDGTIVELRVHTTEGVIGPGEPLMDIVPSGESLLVEARVDPADIDVVHPGLSAKVRLTAFSQRDMHPLDGKVLSVSADRLTEDRTGEAYYLARIVLNEEAGEQLGDGELYPGMQAEVMIVTGSRTALEYLLRPLAASFRRAFKES